MMFSRNAPTSEHFADELLRDTFSIGRFEQPVYALSLLSLVESSTELIALYPGDVALRAAIVKAWATVTEGMLPGKAIYSIRTKKVARRRNDVDLFISLVSNCKGTMKELALWRRRGRHGAEAGAAPHSSF